jgi:fructoselysine-6-P-deglycase FrlB-like protein
MNPGIIKCIAASKDVALMLSLFFNMAACGAIWRLWKSREALQDKVTAMLTELVKELSKMTAKLMEKQ